MKIHLLGKDLDVSDSNKTSFKITSTGEKRETHDKLKIVNNYSDFINAITELKETIIESYYYISVNDDSLILSVANSSATITSGIFTTEIVYNFEFSEIRDTLVELFEIENTKNYKILSANLSNNGNLGPDPLVLKLILSEVATKAAGRQPRFKFYIPKKDGTQREIIAPDNEIKNVLRDINAVLTRVSNNSDCQFAYIPGKNIKHNASVHKKNHYVFNMDIRDFFPSCKREYVRRYILFLFPSCYNREVFINRFLDVILENDALYIGSPVSGNLANSVLRRPVEYISNMAAKTGMRFSIYADDMTFSSDQFISEDYVLALFNSAIEKYNLSDSFKVKESKSYGRQGKHRHITGVSFSDNSKLTVSRKFYRDIRTKLEHLDSGKPVNVKELQGKLAYARLLDETGKIKTYLKKYATTVKKYNLNPTKKKKVKSQ